MADTAETIRRAARDNGWADRTSEPDVLRFTRNGFTVRVDLTSRGGVNAAVRSDGEDVVYADGRGKREAVVEWLTST